MRTARVPRRHPWLDELVANADQAVDELLRGHAYLPGLQRLGACDALMALTGDLPAEAREWPLLDQALCRWLERQRVGGQAAVEQGGGANHFIRKVGEALRAVWRLRLPQSGQWLRDGFADILRWAENLPVTPPMFDLGDAVLLAAAHLQQDRRLRGLWLNVCEQAASRRLRHRLDTGLLGLARMPPATTPGPARDVVVGFARWAVRLQPGEQNAKGDLKRQWLALRGAFPRQGTFWRDILREILDDKEYGRHPFPEWLRAADADLKKAEGKGKPAKRGAEIPPDIPKIIAGYRDRLRRDGLDQALWTDMGNLLHQLEHYADTTGESYYLVHSTSNIGKLLVDPAPGHALALARRAMLWAPANGYLWSLRAKALVRLNRPDLALNVLWEGGRRAPDNVGFASQLSRLLDDDLAEVLLRRALSMVSTDACNVVELARLLARTGRLGESLALLRRTWEQSWGQAEAILYNLASLLLANGVFAEARDTAWEYRRRFGDHPNISRLLTLIDLGAAGQEQELEHLREKPAAESNGTVPVSWDRGGETLAEEMAEEPRLARIGQVAKADIVLSAGGDGRGRAHRELDRLIGLDQNDGYAHLVKALDDAEHRTFLHGQAGRFGGSLPIQLAVTEDEGGYERLRVEFADQASLIDLVRYARGAHTDQVLDRLNRWTGEPQRWDATWETFLQQQVRKHLDGEAALPLPMLAHDALTQRVDVGWGVIPARV